jgi:tetratricopeptide (TPR) repeat protein
VTLWDVAGEKELVREPARTAPIHCLAFAHTGDVRVAVGAAFLRPYPPAGMKVFDQSGAAVAAAAFAPRGGLLAVADDADRTVWLCDPNTARPRFAAERARGYGFLLARTPLARDAAPGESNQRPREDGKIKRRYLQILRDGVCLREHMVDVPAGPLTMRATRDGATLDVQVADLEPLTFQDSFPPPERQGRFGLHWPAATGLASLVLRRQARAPEPSALEEADELFAGGKFQQARELYRREASRPRAADATEEARYKAALCLEKGNRADEARREYEAMGRGEGRWALLADAHLWWLLQERNEFARAEEVLAGSAFGRRPEELFLVLPEEMRQRIVRTYFLSLVGVHSVLPPADLAERLERLVRLTERVPDLSISHEDSVVALMRAYQLRDQPEQALVRAEAYLADADRRVPSWDRLRVAPVLAEYTWLLQSRKEAKEARKKLDQWLFETQGTIRADHYMMPHSLGLLLAERARLDMALGDYEGAEKDVTRCLEFSADKGAWMAEFATTARLIRGFAREAQGDRAGAARAWEEGSLSRVPSVGADKAAKLRYWGVAHLREMLPQLIQAGLADDLSPEEGKAIVLKAIGTFAGDPRLALAVEFLGLEPSTYTSCSTMWRTERGRELARQYALHEIPFPEAVRRPVLLLGHEVIRQQAFGGTSTAEQDRLVWKLLADGFALLRDGKVSKTRLLMPLALAWRSGSMDRWEPVAAELKEGPGRAGHRGAPLPHGPAADQRHAGRRILEGATEVEANLSSPSPRPLRVCGRASSAPGADGLFRKPLAPASGERGWGEGAGFSQAPDPLTPDPSPTEGRGELVGQALT